MMRQNAGVLISLAATILATSGCSPFRAKLNRRDTDNHVAQNVQPASYNARPAEPQARSGPAGLPWNEPSPKNQEVDEKTQQWIALARLSERRDQYEQAEKIYVQILERVPNHPLPYHRMAIIRAKQSKFEEAEQYFAKAYELDPSDATLLSDIGYFYYLTSDAARAEQFLRYALQVDPQHEAAHNNLAILVGERGDLDEARKYFRRVGSEAQTEANLAFIYAQRGELAQAVNSYSRALTLDKDNRPAAHALLNLARHKPKQAGPARGPETSQRPSSSEQPSVMNISSTAGRQPTPAQPAQSFRRAEITIGQPAALDRGVAVTDQPAGRPPEKALLTHLTDFAKGMTADRTPEPAAAAIAIAKPAASPGPRQPEASALWETRSESEPALAVLQDVRRADPVTWLGTTAKEDGATSPSDTSASDEDDVSADRSVAPLGRLQRRLSTLRSDSDGDNHDSDAAESESPGVIVYQAPEFRPTVSVSISDKSADSVSAASYAPAKNDTEDNAGSAGAQPAEPSPEAANKAASATLSDSPDSPSSDGTSAEDAPGTANTFLDSWLTPETPRESSRRGANYSSRRGA